MHIFPLLLIGLAAVVVQPVQSLLVKCQGHQDVHHDPGLLILPRPNQVTINATMTCTTPDMDPNLASVALYQQFNVTSACNRILVNFVSEYDFTWKNGSTSHAIMTSNTVTTGGNRVVQSLGNVTQGLFMGQGISQLEVLPFVPLLQCILGGVTDYGGPISIAIFPPDQVVEPPQLPTN